MPLKWKLRLYYGALLLLLLGLLAGATAAIVRRDFKLEVERREAQINRDTRRLLEERMQALDSAMALALRDPDFLRLVRRDLESAREVTVAEWVPLADSLSRRYELPILKILDAEGIVLSSSHWPASYGLRDSPGLILAFEATMGVRLVREREAEGEFLALLAPRWLPRLRRYALVGGLRADAALETELSERAGVAVRFELEVENADGASAPNALPQLAPADSALETQGTLLLSTPTGASSDLAWIPVFASPAELSGGLHLLFDRSSIGDLTRRLAQIFGLATLAGILLAWTLGLWISSRITRPLEQLAEGVAVLATGRTPHPIAAAGSSEVRELVVSFNQMASSLAESRERLRRAERISAWRDVARRIAHEIKNALVPIQLSVESVARSVHTGRGDLSALADESVAMVRGEVDGLTRLVNSFNEVARLPEPDLETHTLHETWERAVAPFRAQLTIEIQHLHELPAMRYDEDLIRRALQNLVRNAQEAGASRITLHASRHDHGARLLLQDNGTGITAEDLPHVFEPYFTRKNEGTGLGLAIVYKVFVDHGWSVNVDSPVSPSAPAASRGTAFAIDIPAQALVGRENPDVR